MSSAVGISGLLLVVAVKATLILALAATIDYTLLRRHASAAARHLLWTFALGSLLLLPVLSAALPEWRVPPFGGVGSSASLAPYDAQQDGVEAPQSLRQDGSHDLLARGAPAGVEPPLANGVKRTPASPAPEAVALPTIPVPWTALVLGIYVAGVLLLLARMVAERVVVRRLEREATPVRDDAWSVQLEAVSRSLAVRRPVALLRSAVPTVPLTWGCSVPPCCCRLARSYGPRRGARPSCSTSWRTWRGETAWCRRSPPSPALSTGRTPVSGGPLRAFASSGSWHATTRRWSGGFGLATTPGTFSTSRVVPRPVAPCPRLR